MRRPIQRTRTAERTSGEILDGFATADGRVPAGAGNAQPAAMPGRAAGAAGTRRAVRATHMPEGAAERLSALAASGLEDTLSDAEAARNAGMGGVPGAAGAEADGTDGWIEERPTPGNLPAVLQTAIAESGSGIVPDWHMVRHLPGYLQQPIRALGRAVFSQFTDTPVEDIQTVTTLTNDRAEVEALMQWIRVNGARDDRAEMDFEGTIPDYKAEVQLWRTRDLSFLLVKDFGGYYVYGWPGGRGVHLEADPPRPLLR